MPGPPSARSPRRLHGLAAATGPATVCSQRAARVPGDPGPARTSDSDLVRQPTEGHVMSLLTGG